MSNKGLIPWSLLSLLLTAPLAGETLEIRLQPLDGSSIDEPATVTVETLDGPEESEPVTLEGVGPGPLKVDLRRNRTYLVSVRGSGFWIPDRVVHFEAESQVLSIPLFPTGSISGRVRAAGAGEIPGSLAVGFSPIPDSDPGFASGEVQCPIESEKFRCEVPAGDLDLRLRPRRHVSHYHWGAKIEPQKELDLGTLILRRGASIVGWVLPPAHEFEFGDVEVTASPQVFGEVASGEDLERSPILSKTARVNPRGFFEIPGIPAGSYVVEVEHPKYATATLVPVTVLEDSETQVRDIELQLPARLEVHLRPPRHPLSRWLVTLHQKSPVPGYSDQVGDGVASEEGRWIADELEPGRYLLKVADRRGSSWAQQEIEIAAGMAPVEVTLPMMRLEGTVVFDDEPLEARLYFGGKQGAESIRIDSNDEGKFYVFLPQRESWFVDVVSSRPRIDTRVEGLRFRQTADDRWAKTRVEVPVTRVTGQVIDTEGQPVAGATVDGVGPTTMRASTETETAGRFELLGLQEGTWSFESSLTDREGRRSSSERMTLQVSEDNEPPPVRLVLRREKRLEGTVVGPDGFGVPGATILPLPLANGTRVTDHLPSLTTNVDGGFRMSVSEQTDEILLTIVAPGFDLAQTRFDARREESLLIPLGTRGGTLTLRYRGYSESTTGPLPYDTTVYVDSHLVFPHILEGWARAHGIVERDEDQFVIPHLAPGQYTACLGAGTAAYSTGRAPTGGGRCTSGFLPPFGELTLTLTMGEEDLPLSPP